MLHIVLVEPEIPHNTGAIGRTAVALSAKLHLIGPLGFDLSEKSRRRCGLDYWDKLDWQYYASFEEFLATQPADVLDKAYFATTKAPQSYAEVQFPEECWLFFGKESRGLDEELICHRPKQCIRIPMNPAARSLNLSNAVAILAYEVQRQQGFPFMQQSGELHRLEWS